MDIMVKELQIKNHVLLLLMVEEIKLMLLFGFQKAKNYKIFIGQILVILEEYIDILH